MQGHRWRTCQPFNSCSSSASTSGRGRLRATQGTLATGAGEPMMAESMRRHACACDLPKCILCKLPCMRPSKRSDAMCALRFLNSVLHVAHAADHRTGGWEDPDRVQKHHERRAEHLSLPQDTASQPDLVYFGEAGLGTKWQETQACTSAADLLRLYGHLTRIDASRWAPATLLSMRPASWCVPVLGPSCMLSCPASAGFCCAGVGRVAQAVHCHACLLPAGPGQLRGDLPDARGCEEQPQGGARFATAAARRDAGR